MTPLLPGTEVLLVAVVLLAAFFDMRERRIPNWLVLTGLVLAFALNAILFGWAGVTRSAIGLAVGFGVYFVLYLAHAMGAGDVKLMGAVGALVGWQTWFGIFVFTAVLGALAALILMLSKGRLRQGLWNVAFILREICHFRAPYLTRKDLDVGHPEALTLPHGAMIALGSIVFVVVSRFGHAA